MSSSGRPTRDRLAFAAVSPFLVLAALAWIAVVVIARGMGAMSGTMGLGFLAFAGVWVLMMAAMMLPSVAPFAGFYTRSFTVHRGRRMTAFVSGYLVAWGGAAVPVFVLAWIADRLVSDHATAATAFAVAIFVACGVYQLTPLKDRCLALCRSPLGFAMRYRDLHGPARDFRIGVHHGLFCVACCWALMLLLVAFGLMNVAAMVVLAAVVLTEKEWRFGPGLARAAGVVALVLAVAVLFRPSLAGGLYHATTTSKMGGM